MVAYSFKSQFVAPIVAGTKRQTIRADRKRHARAGEALQLYTGMRTRQCRLIGRAVCLEVQPIRIDLWHPAIDLPGVCLITDQDLADFAAADGFPSFDEMRRFWIANDPGINVFSGVLIRWHDFEPAP